LSFLVYSCVWQPTNDGSPWCTFPQESGYTIEGIPEETELGYRINLQRIGSSKLFQDGIEKLTLDIEFHTSHSLRIKASIKCLWSLFYITHCA